METSQWSSRITILCFLSFIAIGIWSSCSGEKNKALDSELSDINIEMHSMTQASTKAFEVSIYVTLYNNGNARVKEVWDVSHGKGTEMYLGRHNLGDIQIRDLSVTDETGSSYIYDESWDVNRSLAEKKYHCGLNPIPRGYEICWGIGEYGRHTYNISYLLTNLVKSLNDYDMIHFTFYDRNALNAEHVKLTIEKPDFAIGTDTGLWGFGFDGYVWREGGKAYLESESMLTGDNYMNVLMRFHKGIFDSSSVSDCSFQDVLDKAMPKDK